LIHLASTHLVNGRPHTTQQEDSDSDRLSEDWMV